MKKIKEIISNKYFIFTVAFLFMLVFLLPAKDLIGGSGDASETIKVIKTFFSADKYISYVMYKGIYAFIPGLVCYNFGNLINVSPLLLMKIFHSLGFAYITVVGFPFLIKSLFKSEPKIWQKYLFIILFFVFEGCVFSFISVDFMSLSLLLMCINSLIKIKEKNESKWYNYLYSGLMLGICTCLSGQFLPSALVLVGYGIYTIVKRNKKNLKKILILLMIFIGSIGLMKGVDKIYVNKVVEPARESGAWLPTGGEWLLTGFTSNMQIINYPKSLPDNLGGTIILSEGIDRNIISAGGVVYGIRGIVLTITKYPVLFCIRWTERLFLGVINDPYNSFPYRSDWISPILSLIITGTMLYVSLYFIKEKSKKIKDLLNFNTLIIISFILAALVPSIGHVENRYYMSIRSLIIAVFCLSPFISNAIKSVCNFFKKYKLRNLKNYKINYNVIVYILFMIMVILLYAAIYQSAGANSTITYKFF